MHTFGRIQASKQADHAERIADRETPRGKLAGTELLQEPWMGFCRERDGSHSRKRACATLENFVGEERAPLLRLRFLFFFVFLIFFNFSTSQE